MANSRTCRTLLKHLPDKITLMQLPGFELIGDLSVNTGKWMRGMSEKLKTRLHSSQETNISAIEDKMEPHVAEEIY